MEQYLNRNEQIIQLCGKNRKHTFKQVGKMFGLTKQRISQIVNTKTKERVFKEIKTDGFAKCGICAKNFRPRFNLKRGRSFLRCTPCRRMLENFGGRDVARFLVRRRDKFTCQSCGLIRTLRIKNRRQLDVHHLNGICGQKSRSYDKMSDMPNLITLCHKCHFNRHDRSSRFQDCGRKKLDKTTIPNSN